MALTPEEERFLDSLSAEDRDAYRKTLEAHKKWNNQQKISAEEQAQYEVANAIDRLRQGLMQFTKGAYQGTQGLSAMSPITDSIGSAAAGVGKGMILLGGRYAKFAGIALQGVQVFTGLLSRAAAQADRQFETYQKLSKSGATMSGSMQDLQRDAKNMGYLVGELDKFESLIIRNSKELAQFGGGAAEGRRIMAKTGAALYENTEQFMQMGISFDEANEYLAGWIAVQNQRGISSRTTYNDMTSSVRQYILEQNIINQLTGQTRADAEKNRAENAKNEIFLATKEDWIAHGRADLADKADQFVDLVSNKLGPITTKSVMESMGRFGTITKDANKLRMSGNEQFQHYLGLWTKGTLSNEEMLYIVSKNAADYNSKEGINRALLQANNEFAIPAHELAKAKTIATSKFLEESIKLKENQNRIMINEGDLETRRYAAMIKSQRDLSKALQDFTDVFDSVFEPVATVYTEILTSFNNGLSNLIGGVADFMKLPVDLQLLALVSKFATGSTAPGVVFGKEIRKRLGVAGEPESSQTPAPAPKSSTAPTSQPKEASAVATSPSNSAIEMIKGFETFRARAYKDRNQYSIGYGTRTDDPDEISGRKSINESEASARLQSFVGKVTPAVATIAQKKQWGQNQFDAMTSFIYNLGPGGFRMLTENGNRTNQEIADAIPLYNKSGGKVAGGLTQRRLSEQALFLRDMPRLAEGGITNQPSIAGEAGPEAVIPLSGGRVPLDLGNTSKFLKSIKSLTEPSNTTTTSTSNLQTSLNEATVAYMAPNPVEEEILNILRSIRRNSTTLANNNQKILRAHTN